MYILHFCDAIKTSTDANKQHPRHLTLLSLIGYAVMSIARNCGLKVIGTRARRHWGRGNGARVGLSWSLIITFSRDY